MGKLWDIIEAHRDAQQYPPSKRQVARNLGVAPSAIENWESPKALPSRENLESIARVTGTPYSIVLAAALEDVGYVDPTLPRDLFELAARDVDREPSTARQRRLQDEGGAGD